MAATATIDIVAKDQATGTIEAVKREVKSLGQNIKDIRSGNASLEQFKSAMDQILSSAKPLNMQVRQLTELAAQIRFQGLEGGEALFDEVLGKAAQMKDVMADMQNETKILSDDLFNLKANMGAMQVGIGIFSGLQAGVSLLGVENEKLLKVMQKLQATQAILNSVTAVANALNKDNALMIKLRKAWTDAQTKSTNMEAAAELRKNAAIAGSVPATAAATAATGALTVAEGAATASTNIFSTSVAVLRAMFGDVTGLITLAALGLTTYAVFADDAAGKTKDLGDEQENLAKKTTAASRAMEVFNSYVGKLASGVSSSVPKFLALAEAFKRCRTEGEKTRFISVYADEINSLGLNIKNAADAENIFVDNTSKVVAALEARAKAAAAFEVMAETYGEVLKAKSNYLRPEYERATKASDLTEDERKQVLKNGIAKRSGAVWSEKDYETDAVLAYVNQQRRLKAQREAYDVYNQAKGKNQVAEVIARSAIKNRINAESNAQGLFSEKDTTKTKATKEKKTKAADYYEGSLEDMETKVKKLQESLRKGWVPDDMVGDVLYSIAELENAIRDKKISLGIKVEPTPAEKVLSELDRITENMQERLNEKKLINPWEKPSKGLDAMKEEYSQYEKQLQIVDDYIKKLGELQKKNSDVWTEAQDEAMKSATAQRQALQEILDKRGEEISNEVERQEMEEQKRLNYAQEIEALGRLGDAFAQASELADVFGDSSSAVALKTTALLAKSTAAIMNDIKMLIPALKGKAIAEGTAQAAAVPFPANIAAIASVVATVLSTFAQIQKFSHGGVVEGSLMEHPIMASRGEIVFNNRQAKSLYDFVASGKLDNARAGGVFGGGEIVGRVQGDDIILVVENRNKIAAKAGISITTL